MGGDLTESQFEPMSVEKATIRAGKSVGEAVSAATETLVSACCPSPRSDAEALVAHILEVDLKSLHDFSDHRLSQLMASRLQQAVYRRARREPLAYLLGTVRFRGIEVCVDPRVIVPWEERTGLLVDVAVGLPHGARVHDVGTGSGAVALAIKRARSDYVVSASDVSADALAVARANALRLDLDIDLKLASDIPPGAYDLVVGSLPFADELQQAVPVAPEFEGHQPRVGVFGGPDGLDVIRSVVASAHRGTELALEHAPSQTPEMHRLLGQAHSLRDAYGDLRVTVGWKG